MRAGGPHERAAAAVLLLVARTVYAFNWYNIGALPTPIEHRFGIGTVEFGIVLGAFLLGAGLFQVPAGLAAIRWGNRTTALASLAVMGAFCLATAFSTSWEALAALRFGAGASAAFFFAPGLGFVTAYFPPGSRGPMIGTYNAGFSLGSAVGLFGGAVIAETYGWSATLAVGGILLLGVFPLVSLLLPREPAAHRGIVPQGREILAAARPVVRSRGLWAIALGGAGLWAGFYIAAQYFVEFAHVAHPTWSLALAAAVPSAMILAEIPGGPFGGWSGERSRDMRRHLVLWGITSGGILAVLPFLSFALVWPAFVVLGFADGVTFAMFYLVPTFLPELRGRGFALSVALLNSIQIFVGSALAIAFAVIAAGLGYVAAWAFAGVASVGFLPALLMLGGVGGRSPGTVPAARIGSDGEGPL